MTRKHLVAMAGLFAISANFSGAALAQKGVVQHQSAAEAVSAQELSKINVSSALPQARRNQFGRASDPWEKPRGKPGTSKQKKGASEAYGLSTAPYSTARVQLIVKGFTNTTSRVPTTGYPFRPTGKLYMRRGSSWSVCTASTIKKGLLVTAAHCVHRFGQGASGWVDQVVFVPAHGPSNDYPYGLWSGVHFIIPTSYYNGTDTCTQTGVVCNNDLALVTVAPQSGIYVGNRVGWYGYGWNGYSYRNSSYFGRTVVQISQLGYPQAFDGGQRMIKTEAAGWYYTSGNLKNTQMGSAQTGGSSGGPWLVNLGSRPSTVSPASLGFRTASNVIVGVTSYGSSLSGFNRQGASYFGQNAEFPGSNYGGYGAGNIGRLMQYVCTNATLGSYC